MSFLLGSSLGVRSPPSFGAGDLAHRFSASGSLRPPGGQPTLTAEIAFRLMRCLEANDRPPRRASGQTRSRTAFLRRLRCGFSVVLRREQHDLAVEIKRQAGIPPGHGRRHPSGSLSSLSSKGHALFPAVLQAFRLCMKIASRGGTAFSLFPFRSPAQHGLSSCPSHTARRGALQTVFFSNFNGKSAVSQIFALAHLTGFARKGSAPLRCGCCSLKHKNPGPSELFSVVARRLASR